MDALPPIQAGAVRLAAYATGPESAPPLLLLHGYPDNAGVWQRVAPHLAQRFRVLAYDIRGAGQSTRPAHTRDYHLACLRDDLRAVIDTLSPGRPVHLVGHDWGSIQSWESVTDPDMAQRIASFTSISGPCLDHAGHWLRNAPPGRWLRQAAKSWYVGLFQAPLLGEALWRAGGERTWHAALRHVEGIDDPPRSPTQVADGVHGIRLYRANVRRCLMRPRALHAQVPVHVIHPRGDHFVSPALLDDLPHWVNDLSRSSLDACHWAPISHPAALATLSGDWVQARDAAA